MLQKRKRLSGPEKLAIVKRYLVDRVPISDLCDEHGLQPSQIYRWQAAVFEHGADVFDMKNGRRSKAAESVKDAKIARLEAVVAARSRSARSAGLKPRALRACGSLPIPTIWPG